MNHFPRILTLLTIAIFAMSLFAAEPNDALIEDATAYAAQYGVSVDEGIRRLELQRRVSDLEGVLTTEEVASFAGLWIQHEPQYRVIVRFTNRAAEARLKARVANSPLADHIETRGARWSLADLEKRQQTLHGHARNVNVRLESDINVVDNTLEIYTVDAPRLNARLAAAGGRLLEGAAVKQVRRLSGTEELLGGNAVNGCTAGFGVRAPSGELGISTAGHCANAQSFQGIALPFRAEQVSSSADVQWNSACDLVQVSNRIDSGIGVRSITSTLSRANQSIGTYVCKMGKTTGRTCGTISSKNYHPAFHTNFGGTFVRVDGGATDLSSDGDSGAPWFVENVAYGIHHGHAAGDDTDAVYMPIDSISAIGVTVLTSDPGANCNLKPIASVGYVIDEPGHALFDASSSYDPDGSIVSYHWNWGDGTSQTTTTPYAEHWYSAGNWSVTVTVTDNEGLSSSTYKMVRICDDGEETCPM